MGAGDQIVIGRNCRSAKGEERNHSNEMYLSLRIEAPFCCVFQRSRSRSVSALRDVLLPR